MDKNKESKELADIRRTIESIMLKIASREEVKSPADIRHPLNKA